MLDTHIFFDPAHPLPSIKTSVDDRDPSSYARDEGSHALMNRKVHALPHGPHAILQFPADVSVELVHENAYADIRGEDGTKTSILSNPSALSEGCLLTQKSSSLRISGAQGTILFKCQDYLTFFDIFFTPSPYAKTFSDHKASKGQAGSGLTGTFGVKAPCAGKSDTFHEQSASLSIRVLSTDSRTQRLFHAFCRDLPSAVAGVMSGYVRNLNIGGIGNKVSVNGQTLTFTTGLSHLLSIQVPASIRVTSESPTQLTLYGLNKEEVSQWASRLRYHIFHKNVYAKPLLQFEGEDVARKETRKK